VITRLKKDTFSHYPLLDGPPALFLKGSFLLYVGKGTHEDTGLFLLSDGTIEEVLFELVDLVPFVRGSSGERI
jgi:hypothetical protein